MQIKEFHHKPASAPTQQPLPQQQPLAAHAAAAIAAATADSSKPFTPSSFAQAIRRSTVDIIIKTGIAVADTVAVAGAAAVGTISASGLAFSDDVMTSGRTRYGEYELNKVLHSSSHSDPISEPIKFTRRRDSSTRQIGKLFPRNHKKRSSMSLPEGAICLLSEIVCENDEDLRPHLPGLLHIATLHLDSCNAEVCHEACQMLQYLLYNLSFKILENNPTDESKAIYSSEYARVAGVIGYLQDVPWGERIWDWELPTLAQPWITSAGSVAAFVQIGMS